jgi:hypothetical protein
MGIDLYTTSPDGASVVAATARDAARGRPDRLGVARRVALGTGVRSGRLRRREDDDYMTLDSRRALDATRAWLAMLAQTEPSLVDRSGSLVDARDDGGVFERLDTVGLGQVLSLARAVQHGIELPDDSEGLLQLASAAPRVSRPEGPMSALLLADGYDVLWMPAPLRFAWDGPMGAVGSTLLLRADLERLPQVLRTDGPPAHDTWLGAWSVVDAFYRVIEAAGDTRCVALSA